MWLSEATHLYPASALAEGRSVPEASDNLVLEVGWRNAPRSNRVVNRCLMGSPEA